jgi:hypothetical protein
VDKFRFLSSVHMKCFRSITRSFLWLTIALGLPAQSHAVVFATDTTITLHNTNYDGADIVVTNCALTVDGPHSFASVQIQNAGVLTHTFYPNGTIPDSTTYTNEPHVLNGTNLALLNYATNAAISLVAVTDSSGSNSYTSPSDCVLLVDTNSQFGIARTEPSGIPDGSTVLVTYMMIFPPIQSGLNLTVTNDFQVASNGAINISGEGFGGNVGTGNGGETFISPISGAGAGHGGYGGASLENAQGGTAYGSFTQPSTLGSGGGQGSGGPGGAGGGAVRLNIGGSMILNGAILANGADATNTRSGGGAGGSVWITAQNYSGTGNIHADGGLGEPTHGGGGGGGRIAVEFNTNFFSGTFSAIGGNGAFRGGAGTIYTTIIGQVGTLLVDNGGVAGTNTLLQVNNSANVIVRGSAVGIMSGSQTMRSLTVTSNAVVTASSSANITVTSNAVVEAGAAIQLDGRGGFVSGAGGVGFSIGSGIYYCGGGGHGGYGGMGGVTNARGGMAVDSTSGPTFSGGNGGGSSSSFSPFGGAGGGALRLIVNGELILNGRVSAEGKIGSGACAGGGAGGSLWLTLGKLSGTGTISANGAPGILPGGGGGAGGRVAVTFNTYSFAGSMTAYGAGGANWGGAGTIYVKTNSSPFALVTMDNGGNAGTNTTFDISSANNYTISGRAVAQLPLTSSIFIGSLLIRSNGTLLTSVFSGTTTLFMNGPVTIDAGGVLMGDGGNSSGSGVGFNSTTSPGGAGHGGFGGGNPNNTGGNAYDSITSPTLTGSAGGSKSGTFAPPFGGAGGAALRIQLPSPPTLLTVNGRLSVNGKDGDSGSGGGSGGSLWIVGGSLAGSGIISANGGAGTLGAGGGAGGRISIQYTSNSFTGTLSASGGSGGVGGGAGTVYLKAQSASFGNLIVNNGGISGTNTPLFSSSSIPSSPFNFTITGNATVVPFTPLPLLSNLTVTAGGVLTARTNDINLAVSVLRNVTIGSGSAITVDGKGFGRATGPGAGSTLSGKGSGGGYGGLGGASASGAPGGTNYGSATQPVDRGSGGGIGSNNFTNGSEGGGAIQLFVGGTLNVSGTLSANGNAGLQDDSGGGAGGSLWIKASALTGGGVISANGGAGELFGGGGGGGGRIAIYTPANTFTGLVSVVGGNGAVSGQNGTVLNSNNLTAFQVTSQSPVGTVSNLVSSFSLGFNEIVNPFSVSASDFVLNTPTGPVASGNLNSSTLNSGVSVNFPILNMPGDYQILAGPNIENIFGQPLSQVYTGAFTIALPTINGTVTNEGGSPVAGVLLQSSDVFLSAISDTNGNYALGVPTGWTGTVTPSQANLVFVPGERVYPNPVTDSVFNENYLAVPTIAPNVGSSLQNTNLLMSWHGIPGVTYQILSSTNLFDWVLYGSPIVGSNIDIQIPALTTNADEFFRVQANN